MSRNHLICIPLALLLLACGEKKKPEAGTAASQVSNDLPDMPVELSDGNTLNARSLTGKTVLVLFQPDCDHCQNEARQIEQNLDAFREYDLYFISSSPMPDIRRFADEYRLSGRENVRFGATSVESVLNNFGAIQAPSTYVYSEGGALVKEFNGEVDISVIRKYL